MIKSESESWLRQQKKKEAISFQPQKESRQVKRSMPLTLGSGWDDVAALVACFATTEVDDDDDESEPSRICVSANEDLREKFNWIVQLSVTNIEQACARLEHTI